MIPVCVFNKFDNKCESIHKVESDVGFLTLACLEFILLKKGNHFEMTLQYANFEQGIDLV